MYSFTKHVLILWFKTFGPHYVASTSVHTHTHTYIFVQFALWGPSLT